MEDHYSPSVLLPLVPDDNYKASVIVLSEDSSTKEAFICDPLSADQKLRNWRRAGRGIKDKNRAWGNAVILPDATVLFVGGINRIHKDPYFDINGTMETEVYHPVSKTWSAGQELLKHARNYHGTAILLYDGRVLVAGSNIDRSDSDPPRRTLALEIYSPDNLWRGPRPQFTITHDKLRVGDTFKIRLKDPWRFKHIRDSRITFIRCCTTTHAFSQDQRCVCISALTGTKQDDQEFMVAIPKNPSLLPPGYYYLFLISQPGAPSVGQIVQIL